MHLYDYLKSEHRKGKSDGELEDSLIGMGYSPERAKRLVENASVMMSQRSPNVPLISAGGIAFVLIAAIALWLTLSNEPAGEIPRLYEKEQNDISLEAAAENTNTPPSDEKPLQEKTALAGLGAESQAEAQEEEVVPVEPLCGNGVIDAGEACDTKNQATKSRGFDCGAYQAIAVNCKGDCSGYQAADCGSCGDGIVNGPEQCETGQTRQYACPDNRTKLPQVCTNSCIWSDVSAGCSSCYNGVKDGTETQVDCGGSCAPCVSCTNGVKDGKETGVDCGGNCVAPSCSMTRGVCAGKTRTCGAAGWADCTTADYGASYEENETKCDSVDNDCDGSIDENNVCFKSTEVKVIVMSYYPLDGQSLDEEITGLGDYLYSVRSKVGQLTEDTASSLTKGSAYHGYKDSAAKPALKYNVIDAKEFLKPMPVSLNEIPWNRGVFRPDYNLMLSSDIDMCDYVDSQGVKEVWVWGYHHGNIEPVESNMAMGLKSQAYWNKGGYGDVSNSEQTDDLPVCQNTYTLYNYNYGRGLGESLEDHSHQIEWLLNWIEDRDAKPAYEWKDLLFWGKFVGSDASHKVVSPGCGWAHYAPNSNNNYEWHNTQGILSDCEDWKPGGNGDRNLVNCRTWNDYFRNENYCVDDSGASFKVWWMQNLPGKDSGLSHNGKALRNWWEFVGDFDSAIAKGKSLTS